MKKLKYILFLIPIFCYLNIGITSAQNSYKPITSIYKISDDEAKTLLQDWSGKITNNYFHTSVDTFSTRAYKRQSLQGYYLFTKANGEEVQVEIKGFHSISAVVLNDERDLTIQVIDSLGNNVNNAKAQFNKKELKYKNDIQAFQKKRVHKDGFLTVHANGQTIYYDLNNQNDRWIIKKRYRRFSTTKVGYLVTTPYRWGRKVWIFFKGKFQGYGGWDWQIFKRRRRNKSHKGYIAFNQPKYQPADTVKLKAYLTTHKGKPLTRDLQLKIYKRYDRRKPFITTTLQPETKGAYTYEFALGDSLKLDQRYVAEFFYKKNKKSVSVLSHDFYYEDYQLDEVEYTFKSKEKIYNKNDKVILFAEGKDKNGWTIPDGQVQLTATLYNVVDFEGEEVYVPDTLWKSTQDLKTRGETQIIFPAENLPSAAMNIRVTGRFSNSNGELHTESLNFSYNGKEAFNEKIMVDLEDEFIVAKYIVDDVEKEIEGDLNIDGGANNIKKSRTIQFPFKEKINPYVNVYNFEIGELKRKFIPRNQEHQVVVAGQQTQDSILISIINPRNLPINYQLRTKNKLISKGKTIDKSFLLQLKNKTHKSVYLYYQFIYGSRSYNLEQSIHHYKKLLSVEVEQPRTVEPGESVQFKVAIKNVKNKPAKNVNLTAGAINAQFDDLANIKEPALTYKPTRKPLAYNEYRLEQFQNKNKRLSISPKWYQELELDKSLFYQLRHPKNGIHFHYTKMTSQDSFYHKVAQFAPYIVKDGKMEPIYLIYCNRKLVYYYDVSDNPPYSFIGQDGENQITIRTRDAVYTFEKVQLKAGHKLEFSIDENQYLKHELGKNITRKSTTIELTRAEKTLLNKKIFLFRNLKRGAQYHIWQDEESVHQIFESKYHHNKVYQIGPFYDNISMRMIEQDGWNNTFRFEPNFIYEVENNRERLYHDPLFQEDVEAFLPERINQKRIGQVALSPKQIQLNTPFKEKIKEWFSRNRNRKRVDNSPSGNYKFKYQKADSSIYAIVLLENDTTFEIYNSSIRQFRYLPPRDFKVFLFTEHGNYIEKDISIKANQTLYQDLSNNAFTNDTAQVLFEKIFLKFGERKGKKNEAQFYFSQNKIKKTDIPPLGSIRVSGIIREDGGDPLIGASIREVGTENGTTTDLDGRYSLLISDGSYAIEISYTGYSTQQIQITDTSSDVNITLNESVSLSEIVVVGYSVPLIKQDETSLGKTVTSQQIRNLPTRNINALAGAISGVRMADDGDAISIRGSRSNATDYYIDGNRVTGLGIEKQKAALGYAVTTVELRSQFSDYAYWQPNLITDQNGEAYFTVTFPDNITAWKTYVVGMDKKSRVGTNISEIKALKKLTAQLSLPRFLIEGDETNIIGKSINFTLDSFNVVTAFKLGDEILKTNETEIKDALIEKAKIAATENMDSLTLSYLLSMENYADGEERQIPIFQKGVEESNGVFRVLNDSTDFQKSFDSSKGAVQVRIEDNVLNVLLEDLDYLKKYPYGCNEQTASRLMALLLEKDLRELLGQKFEDEDKIIKAILRLKKTQRPDGSWGWWANGKENIWMTTYVLNALHQARQANYKTEAWNQGLIFLTNAIEQMKGKELLNTLLLFSDVEQNLDYKKYITQLDTTNTSMYDKFALIKIRQAQDLPYSMDSILQHKKEDLFGGWYFGEENYRWYNNSFQLTLLAHDIFQKNNNTLTVKNIQQYFLAKRSKRGWRNTIETAKILKAILPDLMKNKNGLVKNKVQLSGAINETITEFPYEATFTSDQNLAINKTGSSPIFFTAYQEFWNKKPKKKNDIFSITTHLQQDDKKTDNLKAAVAADLIVKVEVKKAAEYVMIEIPIPAGCSYRSKPNYYRGQESHREYFKNRTAIFCENLPVGTYEYKIPLEPRYSGTYTLNPTRVEQMYFPIFYGRNEMEKIEINE